VDLRQIQPSDFAIENAKKLKKDPRLVELILQNARRVVRMERNVLIVETHQGLVCANAGIDQSNVQSNVPGQELVTVLPRHPDVSAAALHKRLGCPVIISDTFGRPWRLGLVNVAIGVAGLPPLLDYRGKMDRHGRRLESTMIAVADELAAAAGLLMEKAAGSPVVLIYGAPVPPGDGSAKQLLRKGDEDLFR
jgi:coenzyme F420-0:L-glutamate ligase/coenzyme F420-1:gamma-L-glutamate ligase